MKLKPNNATLNCCIRYEDGLDSADELTVNLHAIPVTQKAMDIISLNVDAESLDEEIGGLQDHIEALRRESAEWKDGAVKSTEIVRDLRVALETAQKENKRLRDWIIKEVTKV